MAGERLLQSYILQLLIHFMCHVCGITLKKIDGLTSQQLQYKLDEKYTNEKLGAPSLRAK